MLVQPSASESFRRASLKTNQDGQSGTSKGENKKVPRYIEKRDLTGTVFKSELQGKRTKVWKEYKDPVLTLVYDQTPESRDKKVPAKSGLSEPINSAEPSNPAAMIAQIIKTQKPSGPISIDSVSKDINELKAYAEKKDSEKKASQFAQKPIIINTL